MLRFRSEYACAPRPGVCLSMDNCLNALRPFCGLSGCFRAVGNYYPGCNHAVVSVVRKRHNMTRPIS
jgi:hypothetical protein